MGEVFQFSSPYKWRCSKRFYRLFVYCSWLLIARDNSTGFTLVWGKCVESKVGYTWCTFARSFSTVRNIQTTYDRSSASGDYRASYGLNNSGCNIATDQAHTWYLAIGFS